MMYLSTLEEIMLNSQASKPGKGAILPPMTSKSKLHTPYMSPKL